MRQKKDLIIQLEIYSVALNFIWFTQAKLKTICPFRKGHYNPWQSHHTGLGPVKAACSIPNKPEFFKALFSPRLHL